MRKSSCVTLCEPRGDTILQLQSAFERTKAPSGRRGRSCRRTAELITDCNLAGATTWFVCCRLFGGTRATRSCELDVARAFLRADTDWDIVESNTTLTSWEGGRMDYPVLASDVLGLLFVVLLSWVAVRRAGFGPPNLKSGDPELES